MSLLLQTGQTFSCSPCIMREATLQRHLSLHFIDGKESSIILKTSQIKHTYSHEILYMIGIIAISFSAIFVKWSTAEVSVAAMYRLLLTNLLLLPMLWKYRVEIAGIRLKHWGMLFGSGFTLALHFLLWMASLRYTTVASSTVILTLEPIMVMLGSFFLFKVKANKIMLIGMGVALAGSFVIGFGDFHVSGTALYGDALSFFSVVAVSIHMLLGKQLREHIGAYVYNFFVFAFAGGSLAVYNLLNGFAFGGYPAKEWGLFLLLAIVPTLFGHYLFNWLLKYMHASAVSMAVLGEPVFASLLAWQLLGEKLTALQLIAGCFILAGVWVFIRYGKEDKLSAS